MAPSSKLNRRTDRGSGSPVLLSLLRWSAVFTGISVLAVAQGWGEGAALCDLSRLQLSSKPLSIDLSGESIAATATGMIDFVPKNGNIFDVIENVSIRVNNAQAPLGRLVERQAAEKLPNDECGSVALVQQSDFEVTDGNLVIHIEIQAQQYGCVIGVRALLAQGIMNITVDLRFFVADNKVKSAATTSQAGELNTTVPDFDPDLTDTIKTELNLGSKRIGEDCRESWTPPWLHSRIRPNRSRHYIDRPFDPLSSAK